MQRLYLRFLPAALTRLFFLAISTGTLFFSCGRSRSTDVTAAAHDTLTSPIRYARGFSLTAHENYQLVCIFNPFQAQNDTLKYLLLRQDMPVPDGYPEAQVIRVPVKRIAVTSSMHVGLVTFLEATDALKAIGEVRYIYSENVIDRVRKGEIIEISNGATINEEKLIALQPDLLMETGRPDMGAGSYRTLTDAGIPVIFNLEWMENTPLGRAEWVKLMAALLDRENAAAHQFAMIESNYLDYAQRTADVRESPRVLLGNNLKDTWHMPGGKSFMAQLLHDAGASYEWEDTAETGSLALAFEAVYPFALEADFWMNMYTGSPDDTREALRTMDSRYQDFKAFRNGQLYTFTKRINAQGANDYWETGAFRPDLVLADFVKILHPELAPDHSFYFYKKME